MLQGKGLWMSVSVWDRVTGHNLDSGLVGAAVTDWGVVAQREDVS